MKGYMNGFLLTLQHYILQESLISQDDLGAELICSWHGELVFFVVVVVVVAH